MHKFHYNHAGEQVLRHMGGFKRQEHDPRDEAFRLKSHPMFHASPPSVDLRKFLSPVEDQGSLGSCTANMSAGCVEALEIKAMNANAGVEMFLGFDSSTTASVKVTSVAQAADGTVGFHVAVKAQVAPQPSPTPTPTPAPTPTPVPPPAPKVLLTDMSRLFQYAVTRQLEGTPLSDDGGATIRGAFAAMAKYGCLDEQLDPYIVENFSHTPTAAQFAAALPHKITSFHSIADGDLDTMKAMISQGYLVGFGFSVYSYFMSQDMAMTGWLHLPSPVETEEGGHAVCLCGYDDAKKAFLVRNSWGTDWAASGYFWMDYSYVANKQLCNDFWVAQKNPF